jgi:hypothetical protein
MSGFVESPTAWKGPFDRSSVRRAPSTRSAPIPGVPPPIETEIPISQLPLAARLNGSEDLPVVQNGITCRTTASEVGGIGAPPVQFNKALSLVYVATAKQTVFSLSQQDHYGQTYGLTPNNGVQVIASGSRLVMDDGTGFGQYTINMAANEIVFLHPCGAGEIIVFDIYVLIVPLVTTPIYLNKVLSLVYVATAGQTVFPLSKLDHYGNNYGLTTNSGVQVSASGTRLVMDDGTGFGQYTINLIANEIVFLRPCGAGEIIVFDIYALIDQTVTTVEASVRTDVLPITTENVLPPLSFAPDGQMIVIFVNRTAFFAATSPPDFTISGNVITWTSPHYAVPPGAQVVVMYTYPTPIPAPPPPPPMAQLVDLADFLT